MKHLFPGPEPKRRRAIAVDDTKIKVKGKWNYLWAAIDIDNWEVLSVWIRARKIVLKLWSSLEKF